MQSLRFFEPFKLLVITYTEPFQPPIYLRLQSQLMRPVVLTADMYAPLSTCEPSI